MQLQEAVCGGDRGSRGDGSSPDTTTGKEGAGPPTWI